MDEPFDLGKAIEDYEYDKAVSEGRMAKLPIHCEKCGRFLYVDSKDTIILYEISDVDGLRVPYAFYHRKCYRSNKGV